MRTLIFNARLYTGSGFAEAAVIENGRFTHTGRLSELNGLAAFDRRIDLCGRTAVPGFNDSHMHLLFGGQALGNIDLRACRSFDDIRAAVCSHISGGFRGSIIAGEGWNQDLLLERRAPNRYELDRICPDIPLVLTRICGHQLVANSAAIAAAGVTAATPQPQNGRFETDDSGEPLGIFCEDAMGLIGRLRATPSFEDAAGALDASVKMMNSLGLTSVSTMDINSESLPLVLPVYEAYERGHPTLRVTHQCNFSSPADFSRFIASGHTAGSGSNWNKIGALKLFADGSLGARTALLRSDYADCPGTRGLEAIDPGMLAEFVKLAEQNRFTTVVHAIGDGAVENVLNCYLANSAAGNPFRHGIVHSQITDAALVRRFADQHVQALVQPIFLDYDTTIVRERVGSALADTSYAFASLLHGGGGLSLGSDWPVETPDPIKNIHCAVTRKRLSGGAPYCPNEALTVKEAIDCYTMGSACSTFDENIKGRIAPGYLADLAVLSDNIFEASPDAIQDILVVATMVDGEIVYEA